MSIPIRVKGGKIQIQDATLQPEGYEQLTSLNIVSSLTVPGNARMVLIQAVSQNVRWRDDGTDPVAGVGMRISAGEEFWYTGDLSAIKFIEEAASSELNVSYYASE